jgi:hypothetical protein
MKWFAAFFGSFALLIAVLAFTAPPLEDTRPLPQTPNEAEVIVKKIRMAEGKDVYCLTNSTGSMSCVGP